MSQVDVPRLVDGLAARAHWPFDIVAELMNQAPEVLPDLLHAGIERLARSSPAIDALVSLVDARVLAREGEHGVAVLAAGADPNDSQAASLIAHVSLQDPLLLTGHLDQLWDLGVNGNSYCAPWPWRGATDPVLRERLAGLLGSADALTAGRARACLLQTRDPSLVTRAAAAPLRGPLFLGMDPHYVAWDVDGGTPTRLAPAGIYHLQFPGGYLRPHQWAGASHPVPHPTWHLAASPGLTAAFGGPAVSGPCPGCGGQLHRLLHLPAIPADLGVSTCQALELAACLTCLGWAIPMMFFRHDSSGHIEAAFGAPDANIDCVQEAEQPLPETQVSLAPTPARWQYQDWARANARENLNRIGGEPTWIQDPDYPHCPGCQHRMHFLAQLDSLDFSSRQWLWGSGGIAYIMWCDPCRTSAAFWQCT